MAINTPRMMGEAHKRSILKLLYEHETLSRAELARRLSLSPPAVTTNIGALLEAGMIVQVGSGSSEFGRKPILVSLNKEFIYVVGVDIREKLLYVSLADFAKNIVDVLEEPSLAEQGARAAIDQVVCCVKKLIERNGNRSIGAIAVSAPGIVNRSSGRVEFSTVIADLKDYDLCQILGSEFEVPILIENDVDMAVRGEYQEGSHCACGNMVYLKIGDGAAARIIADGKLLHGGADAAGEIGYMLLDRNYTQEEFHTRGPLEKEICNSTIDRAYKMRTGREEGKEDVYFTLEKIIELSVQGDDCARQLRDEILNLLARAIVNISAIVNTEVVVLGGDLEMLSEAEISSLNHFVGAYVPYPPKIVISEFGQKAGIKGCIANAIDQILKEMGMYIS